MQNGEEKGPYFLQILQTGSFSYFLVKHLPVRDIIQLLRVNSVCYDVIVTELRRTKSLEWDGAFVWRSKDQNFPMVIHNGHAPDSGNADLHEPVIKKLGKSGPELKIRTQKAQALNWLTKYVPRVNSIDIFSEVIWKNSQNSDRYLTKVVLESLAIQFSHLENVKIGRYTGDERNGIVAAILKKNQHRIKQLTFFGNQLIDGFQTSDFGCLEQLQILNLEHLVIFHGYHGVVHGGYNHRNRQNAENRNGDEPKVESWLTNRLIKYPQNIIEFRLPAVDRDIIFDQQDLEFLKRFAQLQILHIHYRYNNRPGQLIGILSALADVNSKPNSAPLEELVMKSSLSRDEIQLLDNFPTLTKLEIWGPLPVGGFISLANCAPNLQLLIINVKHITHPELVRFKLGMLASLEELTLRDLSTDTWYEIIQLLPLERLCLDFENSSLTSIHLIRVIEKLDLLFLPRDMEIVLGPQLKANLKSLCLQKDRHSDKARDTQLLPTDLSSLNHLTLDGELTKDGFIEEYLNLLAHPERLTTLELSFKNFANTKQSLEWVFKHLPFLAHLKLYSKRWDIADFYECKLIAPVGVRVELFDVVQDCNKVFQFCNFTPSDAHLPWWRK